MGEGLWVMCYTVLVWVVGMMIMMVIVIGMGMGMGTGAGGDEGIEKYH